MMTTHRKNNSPKEAKGQEASLQLNNLMKSLRNNTDNNGSETGSTNGGGSDASALVSLGNTSFGFNFDSDERMSNDSKEGQTDSNEDSDVNGGNPNGKTAKLAAAAQSGNAARKKKKAKPNPALEKSESNSGGSGSDEQKSSISSLTNSDNNAEQNGAVAKAVAGLESIARATYPVEKDGMEAALSSGQRKRKEKDTDSGGYNTDDDENKSTKREGGDANPSKPRKKKRGDTQKREERNQREKERSFRIAKQISDLRNLLSNGGIVIPKGTKSSVLTEAANYIRMLQQHQYRSEIDRFQLVQQMQLIGSGAQGQQAAAAIRHVAAQNGVWSLGNFGGVPPKSAMAFYQPNLATSAQEGQTPTPQQEDSNAVFLPTKVEPTDYRFIFNSCGVGMAVASMGGSFIDSRQDLQQAFDKISNLISPPTSGTSDEDPCKPVLIRGAMKNRNDLGMSVTVVKGDDGIAKCFCVTLVKNPTSPFDTSRPVPVSFDAIQNTVASTNAACKGSHIDTAPAFTSG